MTDRIRKRRATFPTHVRLYLWWLRNVWWKLNPPPGHRGWFRDGWEPRDD